MVSLPDFLVPRKKLFGLAIGRSSLRAIEVDSQKKVKSIGEVFFPEDVFLNGRLVNADIFTKAVCEIIAKNTFSTKYVAVGFPEIFVYSREYSVPILDDDDVAEAVSWHVKDLFPFPVEDIYYDWKLLEKTDTEYRVLVVAIQRHLLDSLVNVLISSGLRPLSFEPGASVLARLLSYKPNESIIIVDVSRKGAYVTLSINQKAVFTTVVSVSPEDTAQSYLKNLQQTIVEIADFYKYKHVIVEGSMRIVLTGELATNEWKNAAQKFFPYPITIMDFFVGNPAFNNVYAIATSHITPPIDMSTINLLPAALQKQHDNERQKLLYIALLTRVNIYVALCCIFAGTVFGFLSLEKNKIDTEAKIMTQQVSLEQNSQKDLLAISAIATRMVALFPLKNSHIKKIDEIVGLIPPEVIVTKWEYVDDNLSFGISGIARTREGLLLFKDALEKSPSFGKVTIPIGVLQSSQNIPFTMNFLVEN